MTLSIHGNMPHASGSIELTTEAVERARLSFNPSGNQRVERIKTLTAALYTELQEVVKLAREQKDDTTGREAATAMTHLQAGAMFAVSAVTSRTFYDPTRTDPQATGRGPKPAETDELPVIQAGETLSSVTSAPREVAVEPASPDISDLS